MPVVYYPPPTPPWISTSSGRMALLFGGALASAAFYFYMTTKEPSKHREGEEGLYTVPGLQNIGNTCFANSLLQALASSPSFVNWLNNLDYSRVPLRKVQFLMALRDTLNGLNYSKTPTASATAVIEALTYHGWNIGLGREQDLYELFNVFVTTWDDELKCLRMVLRYSLSHVGGESRSPSSSTEEPASGDESENSRETINNNCCRVRSDDFAFLREIFANCHQDLKQTASIRPPCAGTIASQLQCCQPDCLKKKVRYDEFCVISLSIPKSFSYIQVTLDALLRKYFTVEAIKDASCDFCKSQFQRSNGGLMKKQGFCKLPESLVLRIERIEFSPTGGSFKRSDHVKFPEFLDIRDYCFNHSREGEYSRGEVHRHFTKHSLPKIVTGSATQSNLSTDALRQADIMLQRISDSIHSKNFKYELRAVSEHLGGADSGHFVTYRKALDNVSNFWFRTSDSHVTRVAFSAVEASEAYLLIYERVHSPPVPQKTFSDIVLD
ncbi:hypothetical protein QR680_013074 [Steinernema hermaphroditum]|uniref:Ubiquitin carboxyl-terminal hydrolase n=1 Tax=Steinernema hermaphroditum TaxID=289476 RepID=A0AA39I4A3_9BILA|nr:hypothetical protein QR680_013074 [Steinernema hermaphroditum]